MVSHKGDGKYIGENLIMAFEKPDFMIKEVWEVQGSGLEGSEVLRSGFRGSGLRGLRVFVGFRRRGEADGLKRGRWKAMKLIAEGHRS